MKGGVKILFSDFDNYKNVCDNVLSLIKEQGYVSIHDIHIILKIISGYPYCLDQEGHFSYKGKFYNSMENLPLEALKDIKCRLEHEGTI